MAHRNNDNKLDVVMEMLIENGFEGFADVLRILLNEAMKIEREQALGAVLYERSDQRKGYANGYKPRNIDTRMGRLSVDVPQVRGDVDFYPSALERGREIIGVSVSLGEAETHWRRFLKDLKKRQLAGVKYIASDDHDGLKAALNAEFTGVIWQRCQCHLQRNAVKYAPKVSMRSRAAEDLRDIFNAKDLLSAEERLQKCVDKYSKSAPRLAEWIEENIPEGLAVFALPGKHRRRMRTTNMLERLHEEIKRRTRVARLFPNEASLLRLVSAIEMELSEDWIAGKSYFDMNVEMENENESADSKEKGIYRENVA